MKRAATVLGLFLAAVLMGCGGGQSTGDTTPTGGGEDDSAGGDSGDVLIPEEKFEEIRTTFERKVSYVSRCHPEGVEAGEITANDKVTLTLGLTILPSGSPTNIRVLEASKKSPAVEACVIAAAEKWLFPTLPKELDTSHIYSLTNF